MQISELKIVDEVEIDLVKVVLTIGFLWSTFALRIAVVEVKNDLVKLVLTIGAHIDCRQS